MIRKYHELAKLTLFGAFVVETAILIRTIIIIRNQTMVVNTLENLSEYYVDILEKNDVHLTDYDLIALNTILESPSITAIGYRD